MSGPVSKRQPPREERYSSRALQIFMRSGLSEGLKVKAAQAGAPPEILLYDEIGIYGITAKDFLLALSDAGAGPVLLRINSPGGDVFDGLAIYNAVRSHAGGVSVIVDGLAASAASFIAMAGKTISMAEQSMLMIHNAWGIAMGDRHVFADMAGTMEKVDGQLASIYAARSGQPAADIAAMMDAETWFTSTEAKDAGLCDVVLSGASPSKNAKRKPAPAADAPGDLAARRRRLQLAQADVASGDARHAARLDLLRETANSLQPLSPADMAAKRRRVARAVDDLRRPVRARGL